LCNCTEVNDFKSWIFRSIVFR